MENIYETPEQQMAGEAGSGKATAQTILERGSEAFGQAEKAVSDAYEKTAQKVSEMYDKTKAYSNENPGKTILIALGTGVGLGILLGASSRQSRTSRIAHPVIDALSDIAHEIFH